MTADASALLEDGKAVPRSSSKRKGTWTGRTLAPMGSGSLRGSVLALASTAFGSGVLALPWVYASMGLALGSALMAAGAFAAFASLRLLANAAWATGAQDYAEIVRRALGPRTVLFLDFVLVLYCGGAVCGYYVFIEQFGPLLTESLGLPAWFQRPTNLVMLLTAFPVLPMCLTRTLSSLRYASLVSTASLIAVAVMLIVQTPGKYAEMSSAGQIGDLISPPVGVWRLLPRAAAIFFFAFCCHINACAAYAGMDDPVPYRVDKVISRSVLLMVFVYGCVGVCGFVSYGPACAEEVPESPWPSCTPTNILASPRFNGPVSALSRLCMAVALCVAIPLNLHAARAILQRWLPSAPDRQAPRDRDQSSLYVHIALTVLILGSMLSLAVLYRNVNNILGVLGGFAAVSFMFVIPTSITLSLHLKPQAEGPAEVPRIGQWLGVSRGGVVFVTAFLAVCVGTGYFSAGTAVCEIVASAR
eukprot:CAMPEP_0204594614 /NCGR_PEP_ID=MMETSP0661-20131031/52180_1 /ASSEMBLY_ACC=CAM_ASM_000606 /TAXON_ID=109239 /ORGANISM="Alexandrium margalefi, Strain AMGDE01CS-322" /LENGTH=472 /DNA_ID=CAMNT_0051605033 /DNA_START=37 /DNA_END=1455 /DNA_ORIENTATION=+